MSGRGVLFLCVANSARSQMAEGIARSMALPGVEVWSAGSAPSHVRPEAVTVLAEIGIDISTHRSKAVAEVPADRVEAVITLCSEENCSVFVGHAEWLSWSLLDPAGRAGDQLTRLEAFRETCDELRRRLTVLLRQGDL
jgi:arsenate reductase